MLFGQFYAQPEPHPNLDDVFHFKSLSIRHMLFLHLTCSKQNSRDLTHIVMSHGAPIFQATFFMLLPEIPKQQTWSHGNLYSGKGGIPYIFQQACVTVRITMLRRPLDRFS
jgi:hypothetical protein